MSASAEGAFLLYFPEQKKHLGRRKKSFQSSMHYKSKSFPSLERSVFSASSSAYTYRYKIFVLGNRGCNFRIPEAIF